MEGKQPDGSMMDSYSGQSERKQGYLRTKVLIVCGLAALFCMGAMTILLAEIGGAAPRTARGQSERAGVLRQTTPRDGASLRNENAIRSATPRSRQDGNARGASSARGERGRQ